MKQNRAGKFVFKGKFPLIKFGIFADDSDQSESDNLSNPAETKDVVISILEPENEDFHVSPAVAVAEEHDHLHDVDVEGNFDREVGDEDFKGDDDFLKEPDFTRISDDIPSSIELNLDDDDCGPLPGFDSRCFKKVNEVAQPATETGEDVSALKILLSSSKPMEVSSSPRDVVSEIPPPELNGVSTISQAPPVSSIVTTTTVSTPPIPSEEGPSTIYEAGGLSSIPEYFPSRPSQDEASIRLAKHLAQNSPISSSQGKAISFEEEHSGDDKTLVSKFREEIGIIRQDVIEKNILLDQHESYIIELRERDELKTKQITDLQTNLDPPVAPTQSTEGDFPVDPPLPRTTTVVNGFDKEPENSRSSITIKQGKRTVTASKSERLLFMKNSNENHKAKDPVLTVMDLKKRKFGDEFGDRSEIRMWAFNPESNMWVVKRNSGIPKYYKSIHDFNSWTKVDLVELSRALFHNPSEDPSTTNFKRFLDRQVKENFSKMKTAKALYRKDTDVHDPESGEPMKIILWPATKQLKEIPIPQHFHEGYLDNMEFWAFDDENATAAIKFKDREQVLRLISAKDLLKFRERDIRTLSRHQIICRKDVMEAAAKEFTGMVATIINGKLWMGSMGKSDLKLFKKSGE
ncbi:unnamed protein product [Lactuca saligna]|uniref:Uncharacterized protein n=1 Tax=Lactuca saligna TaxID=75948 RepID=A0AA35YXU2_LACSI|nr:unnamed protein product [Lactuca saligna]